MTTAVIGATGRVGSEIVRGILRRGEPVAALVRDPDKARRTFGEPDGLRIRLTRLDDPRELAQALVGIRTVFIAMGSIGIEGVVQLMAINAAARTSSIEQVTRLSVLNASAGSLGINQRAHYSIDQFAFSTAVPYSTIRPAIFSASLLAAAPEVRASRTWTGLADSGRTALIDHSDVAEAGLRVLTDHPTLWGAHHELTGPVAISWPETLELLIAREWAILAGENDYTTDTFQQITGRPPRPLSEFLHEHRAQFA
jgi:NAD(P)H dehydrogenase (quinone)